MTDYDSSTPVSLGSPLDYFSQLVETQKKSMTEALIAGGNPEFNIWGRELNLMSSCTELNKKENIVCLYFNDSHFELVAWKMNKFESVPSSILWF